MTKNLLMWEGFLMVKLSTQLLLITQQDSTSKYDKTKPYFIFTILLGKMSTHITILMKGTNFKAFV